MLKAKYVKTSNLIALFERFHDTVIRKSKIRAEKDVVFLVIPSKKCNGWVKINGWVKSAEEHAHEINITPDRIPLGFDSVASTIIHEMVHIRNYDSGVPDCDERTQFHSEAFREMAKKMGLEVAFNPRHGYSDTTPGPRLHRLIEDFKSNEKNKKVIQEWFTSCRM